MRNTFYLSPLIVTLIAMGSSVSAQANTSACLDQFYRSTPPVVQKESLEKNSYALCFNGFNALYSGVSKTSLWVAEALTPERLSQKIQREDSFHEETRVDRQHRALLSDYRGSGYDRGHLAPNADMPNKAAQYDSFSLANMVPQTPQNNQQVWRELEEATRALVTKQKQDVYVVTGPEYSGKNIKAIGKNKVLVPTATYKAIYAPKSGVIGAYYVSNDMKVAKPKVEIMSICALEDKLGINLFPQLSSEQKRDTYQLPLTAGTVKANQKIAYAHWDEKSKCGADTTKTQIKALQQQFKPHADYVGVAVNKQVDDEQVSPRPDNNTATTEDENASSGVIRIVVKLLMELLQMILQMLK